MFPGLGYAETSRRAARLAQLLTVVAMLWGSNGFTV